MRNCGWLGRQAPPGVLLCLSALVVLFLALPTSAVSGASEGSGPGVEPSGTAQDAAGGEAKPPAALGQRPLAFVPNAGQIDPRVRFAAQAGGASFFFMQKEAMLAFAERDKTLILRLAFLGANGKPRIVGQRRAAGRINYLLGDDPSKWRIDLPTYRQVVYRELWPGIDFVVRGTAGMLKYEFRLAPGARASDIRLAYRGAERLALGSAGDLQIETPLGRLRDTRPRSHQFAGGRRVGVASRFVLGQGATGFGFGVGAYDPSRPLVIDPGLVYSSFLGGSGFDQASGVAVGADASVYVTGVTSSPNLPLGTGQRTFSGGASDAFVTKLSAVGSHVYTTYLGGSGAEHGHVVYDGLNTLDVPYGGVAVDAAGNAHLTGVTCSSDFPTQAAYQASSGGGGCDAFVSKLNAAGNALAFSTYLGGLGNDGASEIGLGTDGSIYLAGFTSALNFPTQNAFQGSRGGGLDAFVAGLSADGSTLLFSSYLGGSADDWARDLAVDASGNAYATGSTQSANFPTTTGALQTTLSGPRDGFVTKVSAAGARVYSTLLGGSATDEANGIAVGGDGSAYVTGTIFGAAVLSVYVKKLNPAANALTYSTQFGGSGSPFGFGDDRGFDIAVDAAGSPYVTGSTSPAGIPTLPFPSTTNAAQPRYGGGGDDAFVTKLSPSGSGFAYSSYLGGGGFDVGTAIALGAGGKVYVSGFTSSSSGFPLSADPAQPVHGGGTQDAFVTTLETDLAIQPTTYQVNSNADPGDGVCDTTCTLRDAILASNLLGARDTIAFRDLPAGQTTIAPSSELPTLLDPVIIDGSTQPSFAGTPIVELSGINAGATANGLVLSRPWPAGGEGGSTVRALVINRFAGIGLVLNDSRDGGNTIVGNFIGTDVSGRNPRGNGIGCVSLPPSCSTAGGGVRFTSVGENRIGGPAPEDRNVVAGNDGLRGPQISANPFGSSGFVRVEGNHIGVNVLGISMSINQPGCCYGTNLDIIGPGGVIADNRIGMGLTGIDVRSLVGGPGFTIKGNRIGGSGAISTSFAGIVVGGAGKVIVGTSEPGGANVISFNSGIGVRVSDASANAQIRFNRIFASGVPTNLNNVNSLGIDLGQAGVTPNDPGDIDTGPNGLQNFPELSSVTVGAGGTTIAGTLNSIRDRTFEIDFYSNVAGIDSFSGKPYPACDPSGHGEGETYLGTTSVTTDASGAAPFSHTVSGVLAAGAMVTATATDPAGNTSEFSACRGPQSGANGTIVVRKQTVPTGSSQSFAFATSYGPGFSLTDGQSNTSGPLAAGSYSVSEAAVTGWDASASCSDGSPPNSIDLSSGENVTCTFTNTQRGSVTLRKTTNGVVDPSKDILFVLTGPGLPTGGISRSTLGDQDGILDFGSGNLIPAQTYTICETPVPAGFTSFWKLDGVIVTPYNPDASRTPPEDLGTRCFAFSVSPGQRRAFEVDNSRPGGDPRTIGYWKNWNRCTSGNQAATAQKNGGAAAGFFLVEDLLPQTIGDFSVTSCQQAVKLLSKQDQAGKSKASDAAYELGAQLLAARFNLAAGAETCSAVQQAVLDGQTLLDGINFSGSGDYLGSKSKDPRRAQALALAATLDRYNNGNLC